jgi:hypothetical protein
MPGAMKTEARRNATSREKSMESSNLRGTGLRVRAAGGRLPFRFGGAAIRDLSDRSLRSSSY